MSGYRVNRTTAPLTVPRIRRCLHGILVGPLDDYGVEADTPVCSTYCDACDDLWCRGQHPAQTFSVEVEKGNPE